jgi:hypothetical protein
VQHEQHAGLNNRAENSHQPTRERERRMRGFKSPGQAQRFLSAFGVIAPFFRPCRHLLAAVNYREIMRRRFTRRRLLELIVFAPGLASVNRRHTDSGVSDNPWMLVIDRHLRRESACSLAIADAHYA